MQVSLQQALLTEIKFDQESAGKDAVFVCSCGHAKGRTDKPWCDGTHRKLVSTRASKWLRQFHFISSVNCCFILDAHRLTLQKYVYRIRIPSCDWNHCGNVMYTITHVRLFGWMFLVDDYAPIFLQLCRSRHRMWFFESSKSEQQSTIKNTNTLAANIKIPSSSKIKSNFLK